MITIEHSRSQRGVALLAAVLVVALATILIAGLLDRGTLGQSRALQHTRSAQAYAFQQGLELWAARILRDDLERGGSDSRNDMWAQPMPPITVPEGLIHGRMRDLDGCLNLNALWTAEDGENSLAISRFQRLLRVLELDPGLADAIVDWLDDDGVARRGGGEDAAYAALSPPRRPANRPFVHSSELRAVIGIDDEIHQRLLPHVCARPDGGNTLNVNTASPQVLMSLDDAIGPALARRLHQDGRADFADHQQFRDRLIEQEALQLAADALRDVVATSRYFVAEAEVLMSEVPVRLYSLLDRDRAGGRIRVLARSVGRY